MENKTKDSKPEVNAGLSEEERKKIEAKHARKQALKNKAKDFLNPKSEFRGGGRLLQLTGTDKLAKRFISRVGGSEYSDTSDKYADPNKDKLKRWFDEKWVDVKTGKPCGRKDAKNSSRDYPACRPSVRINSDTPKTSKELSSEEKEKFTKVKNSRKRIPYNHKKDVDKSNSKSYNKNIPKDKNLYNKVKAEADKVYGKPSAYKSGWIVKTYKERGGEYKTVVSDKKYSQTIDPLERDNLIINGLHKEVKYIEACDKGRCTKDSKYYDALDSIIAFKQRDKNQILNNNNKSEEEFSEEKIYSSWNLFNEFCNNLTQ